MRSSRPISFNRRGQCSGLGVYAPETVRVLTQRSTLLWAGGSKSRSRQANGANSRSLENVLASAERPDGASGNRKFESISLQRRVHCEPVRCFSPARVIASTTLHF